MKKQSESDSPTYTLKYRKNNLGLMKLSKVFSGAMAQDQLGATWKGNIDPPCPYLNGLGPSRDKLTTPLINHQPLKI
jgi:hypothetical protein